MEALRSGRNLSMAAIFVTLLCSVAFSSDMGGRWIDPARLREMQAQGMGLWLIDIRSALTYDDCHIEGAVNIPANALPHKKFPSGKTIVIVDDSLGSDAALQAADALAKSGHERVYLLQGGIAGWRAEGLPVAGRRPDRATGVTAGDLKSAIERKVPLRIFDLRTNAAPILSSLPSVDRPEGKDLEEKLRNLRAMLSDEKRNELQRSLGRHKTTVLIFSASEDAGGIIEKAFPGSREDIRYLIGGHESLTANKAEKRGGCKTCPDK